jgi:hypothetical protein
MRSTGAEEVSAGGAGGVVNIKVDGASPRSGNGVGGLLWDWVMCGTNIGAPKNAALGDATPAPGSSGAIGLGGIRAAPLKIEGHTLSLESWA